MCQANGGARLHLCWSTALCRKIPAQVSPPSRRRWVGRRGRAGTCTGRRQGSGRGGHRRRCWRRPWHIGAASSFVTRLLQHAITGNTLQRPPWGRARPPAHRPVAVISRGMADGFTRAADNQPGRIRAPGRRSAELAAGLPPVDPLHTLPLLAGQMIGAMCGQQSSEHLLAPPLLPAACWPLHAMAGERTRPDAIGSHANPGPSTRNA